MVFPLASGCGAAEATAPATARATFPEWLASCSSVTGSRSGTPTGAGRARPIRRSASSASNRRSTRRARLGMVDAIYASDLVRAHHTAELVAAQLGVDVVVEPGLRERSAGEWEGRTRAEIDEGWPGYLETGRRPAGYEPDASVLDRVLGALDAIAAMPTTATCSCHARRGRARRRAPSRQRRRRADPEPRAASGWSTTTRGCDSGSGSSCSTTSQVTSPAAALTGARYQCASRGRKLTSSPNPEHRLLSDPLATGPAAMADGPDHDHDPEHPDSELEAEQRHLDTAYARLDVMRRAAERVAGGVHGGHPGRHPPGPPGA